MSSAPPAGRPPRTAWERVTANARPQPAIPAVFVLLIAVLMPLMSVDPQAPAGFVIGGWRSILAAVGIVAGAGLAIAAGFCSVFPQLAFIAFAAWLLDFTRDGPLAAWHAGLLWAGIAAAGAMFVFQLYRVATGRFVPTLTDPADAGDGQHGR